VYNGDWDACVPYTDGDAWTSGMGYPVKRHWQVRMRCSCAADTALICGRPQSWTFTSEVFNTTEVLGAARAAVVEE
jgi:hypothetical protein